MGKLTLGIAVFGAGLLIGFAFGVGIPRTSRPAHATLASTEVTWQLLPVLVEPPSEHPPASRVRSRGEGVLLPVQPRSSGESVVDASHPPDA